MGDTVTIVLGGHGDIRDYQRALASLPSVTEAEAKQAAARLARAMLISLAESRMLRAFATTGHGRWGMPSTPPLDGDAPRGTGGPMR